jgi:pimeloyl-ACP methyl ester carboxylesterase
MCLQRMVRKIFRLRLPVTIALVLLAILLAFAVVGCSLADGGSEASHKQKAPKGTFELSNGHSLYIECRGSGSPTIVFEIGLEEPRSDVSYLQDTLARQYMTCSYDRANNGESGRAPTPRTAGDVVSDLHQLLKKAEVPGPYALSGSSIGGFFAQLYGRRYSEEVVGVVAMNPEPPADQIVERIHPLAGFTKEVREENRTYLRGENPEGIDWFASSEELNKAPPPPPIPLEMLLSKRVPGCEGDPLCLKSDATYVEIEREVAQQWPQSSVHKVDAGHVMFLDKPEVAVEAVKRVASK